MVILAFDQATSCSGFSVWVDGQLSTYGKKELNDIDTMQRIHKVACWVDSLIDNYTPNIVIIENIQMQQGNVATYQKLAWLQGAIIKTVFDKHLPLKIITPSEWRAICNFLKGEDKHRENQKKIAQQWVYEQLAQKCTQDEADAICIGYAATKQFDNELNWE